MGLLKKRIQGVSILESLVAIAIILLTLTLSAGVYAGITENKKGLKSILLHNECEKIMTDMELKKVLVPTVLQIDAYKYNVQVSAYKDFKNISQVTIKVYNADENFAKEAKKLYEFNKLVSIDQKENDV